MRVRQALIAAKQISEDHTHKRFVTAQDLR